MGKTTKINVFLSLQLNLSFNTTVYVDLIFYQPTNVGLSK